MDRLEHIKEISIPSPSKIALVVIDGLGGLPQPETGKTELETAQTPNLDYLIKKGVCGLTDPVSPGFTPGSAPAHLALFGYDPFQFTIGRGILEAVGIDFPLQEGDIAARGNFCTIDKEGIIRDRRAGRITNEKCIELCQELNTIKIDGAKLLVSPVQGHRFVLVLRGNNLHPELSDSDPQRVGVKPNQISAVETIAKETADLTNAWITKAKVILASSYPANMVLLRGFSRHPNLPSMSEVYKLKPVAIATYPMYRGLARLLGMEVVTSGSSIEEEFIALKEYYTNHDFFFLHVKHADTAGEDGDFYRKVKVIEEVDAAIPRLIDLKPEVIIVTGDHSTPAILKGHSWHSVPFLLYSQWCRPDEVTEFSERACAHGSLGRFPALEAMPLALAYALKLTKFGA